MAHSNTVLTLNTVSGVVGAVPESYLTHPVLGETLVEVPEGTKSYDPEFWHPTTAKEHKEKETTKRKQDSDQVLATFEKDV